MEKDRGIYFDLGGVYFTNGLRLGLEKLSQVYKVPVSLLEEVFQKGPGAKVRTGEITPEQFWQQSLAIIGIPLMELDRIKKIWFLSYEEHHGIKNFILSLGKHYKVGLLTNNFKDRIDFLEKKYHFKKLFDVAIYSYEVGCKKPDRKIYEVAIEKMSVEPKNVVFIDDHDYSDVVRQLGSKFIVFQNVNQLRIDINEAFLHKSP